MLRTVVSAVLKHTKQDSAGALRIWDLCFVERTERIKIEFGIVDGSHLPGLSMM